MANKFELLGTVTTVEELVNILHDNAVDEDAKVSTCGAKCHVIAQYGIDGNVTNIILEDDDYTDEWNEEYEGEDRYYTVVYEDDLETLGSDTDTFTTKKEAEDMIAREMENAKEYYAQHGLEYSVKEYTDRFGNHVTKIETNGKEWSSWTRKY